MTASFTISRLPLPTCQAHGSQGRYVADGTDDWYCVQCLHFAERWAETVVQDFREFHRNHDVRQRSCPYCNPGVMS